MNRLYRPDIDGLRALSVLLVVLFHIKADGFDGGFVGVDIFFVISGYLISGNIFRETKEAKKFLLKDFYSKRIKRLIPALYFTIIISLLISFLCMTPNHFLMTAKSSVAALFSSSNFYFWSESGYFDQAASLKPLLHTWSLGIEEQFYLVWPVICLLISNLKIKYKLVILGLLFTASLSVSYLPKIGESSLFYLLPFRVFEFCSGAILSLIEVKQGKKWSNIFSITGLGLIFYSTFIFDKNTFYPGLNALIPCIGAVFLIYSKYSWINTKLLSNQRLVQIGLRSYSIYLVHWPLIVFVQYMAGEANNLEKLLLFLFSLIFGNLLYKYIETPFRSSSIHEPIKVFKQFILVSLFLLFLSGLTIYYEGFPSRSKTEFSFNEVKYGGGNCEDPCLLGQGSGKYIYVVGESFSRQLAHGLKEVFPNYNFKVFNHVRCTFFSTEWSRFVSKNDIEKCDHEQTVFFDDLKKNKIKKIIFANNWSRQMFYRKKNQEIEILEFSKPYSKEKALFVFKEVEKFKKKFNIKDIMIMGNPPRLDYKLLNICLTQTSTMKNIRQVLSIFNRKHKEKFLNDCSEIERTSFKNIGRNYLSRYQNVDINVLDPYEAFCNKNTCKVFVKNRLLYSDNDHLSLEGSYELINYFKKEIGDWIEV